MLLTRSIGMPHSLRSAGKAEITRPDFVKGKAALKA
jgi:hypothetical protein